MIPENWLSGGWIQTFTGRRFYPLSPRIEDICIDDIAHALSNICRYGGHSRQFYSVAQHSCMVSDWCPSEHKLEGLMHDTPEAYLGDIVRPVKHSDGMTFYRKAEGRVEMLINASFDVDVTPDSRVIVKHFDNRALFTERKFLLNNSSMDWSMPESEPFPIDHLDAWTPEQAEDEFLERYYTLQRARVSQ